MNPELLRLRHVETPCPKCEGIGGRYYGGGATWRGGMSTCRITWDVCDECWGSGDASKHWVNLRQLEAQESARVTARAATLLVDRLGMSMSALKPAGLALAQELDKQSRRRKPPLGDGFWEQQHWVIVCSGLAKLLREMANVDET